MAIADRVAEGIDRRLAFHQRLKLSIRIIGHRVVVGVDGHGAHRGRQIQRIDLQIVAVPVDVVARQIDADSRAVFVDSGLVVDGLRREVVDGDFGAGEFGRVAGRIGCRRGYDLALYG